MDPADPVDPVDLLLDPAVDLLLDPDAEIPLYRTALLQTHFRQDRLPDHLPDHLLDHLTHHPRVLVAFSRMILRLRLKLPRRRRHN